MLNFVLIFLYLLIHWIADFIAQTDNEAINKSKSIKYLLKHTSKYGLILTLFTYMLWYLGFFGVQFWYIPLIFGIIQFVTHSIIDYFTSRYNSKLWQKGDRHNFFVMIGLDQYIHYVILFGSLCILFY